jgi:hypothetical protein
MTDATGQFDITRFPQHARAADMIAEKTVAGAFLDFLEEQGYTLCTQEKGGYRLDVTYQPIDMPNDRLIASFIDVDYATFQDEKDQMLEDFRVAVAAKVVG